jgi:NTP pyrophosphatase (non-canonical NTP hydrolase)
MTLPLHDITLSAIQAQMLAATVKHGERTVLSRTMSEYEKLVILVEEVGEVARAMTYDNGSHDQLLRELLQVACVAAGWAQALDAMNGGE